MNEQPHPGHHDCLHTMAAKVVAEAFLTLLTEHEELADLYLLTGGPPIIVVREEGE